MGRNKNKFQKKTINEKNKKENQNDKISSSSSFE